MEYIDKIFYRKVNPSDFKKLYDIDKPESGGGQTYLEAAGISHEDMADFLSYAEESESPLEGETRHIYTINAYILGDAKRTHEFIEFAPRKGRNNYRISRQNMKYKHPAWRIENGFPEPNKDAIGEYQSDVTFGGIIDNLIIIIIRTTYKKYYASFINIERIPDTWPSNIGLERIFMNERRGVLSFSDYYVPFINNRTNPFGEIETKERVITGTNILLYGVPGSGKSYTIQKEYCSDENRMERLVFHPDYTYSDFVGQILPDVSEGSVTYRFMPGPFTSILKKAYENPAQEFFLIIEEINRGNAPAIFGEVFQLLDRKEDINDEHDDGFSIGTSEYGISNTNIATIVYGDPNHKVRIPSNLSIIGTMNTSDQNVFTLDTAFQRRWAMRMVNSSFENVAADFRNHLILDTDITWEGFCDGINTIILQKSARITSSEDKRLGPYFIHKSDLVFDPEEDNAQADDATKMKACRNNRRFAEKVLKYLWDDAFKFSRGDVFKMDNYYSLEQIIHHFVANRGDARFSMFTEDVVDRFKMPHLN